MLVVLGVSQPSNRAADSSADCVRQAPRCAASLKESLEVMLEASSPNPSNYQ